MNLKESLEKLQNLSDNKKKIVLWTVVGVLAVIMGFFWVRGAVDSLSKIGDVAKSINLPSIDLPAMPSTDILKNTPQADQTLEPTPNEIEGWKTYTNTDYGFEIKYPGNLYFKEYPKVRDWWGMQFYDENNKVYLTVDLNETTNIKDGTWEKMEKVNIGGVDGNRIETSPPNNCYNVLVEKNGIAYILGDDCLDDSPLFKQIISTFKFTK